MGLIAARSVSPRPPFSEPVIPEKHESNESGVKQIHRFVDVAFVLAWGRRSRRRYSIFEDLLAVCDRWQSSGD
jgi:hypothetical protein